MQTSQKWGASQCEEQRGWSLKQYHSKANIYVVIQEHPRKSQMNLGDYPEEICLSGLQTRLCFKRLSQIMFNF